MQPLRPYERLDEAGVVVLEKILYPFVDGTIYLSWFVVLDGYNLQLRLNPSSILSLELINVLIGILRGRAQAASKDEQARPRKRNLVHKTKRRKKIWI